MSVSVFNNSNNAPVNNQHYDYDALVKLIIVGPSGAGKSSMLSRYCDELYQVSSLPTIGVDFRIKNKTLAVDGTTTRCKIQMWDTAGQERFKSIVQSYYRNAHGVLVVFDLTSRQSFDMLDHWFEQVADFAPPGAARLLVASKSDMTTQRTVDEAEARAAAERHGAEYIEVSARRNINIDEAFAQIQHSALAAWHEQRPTLGPGRKVVDVTSSRRVRSSGCFGFLFGR